MHNIHDSYLLEVDDVANLSRGKCQDALKFINTSMPDIRFLTLTLTLTLTCCVAGCGEIIPDGNGEKENALRNINAFVLPVKQTDHSISGVYDMALRQANNNETKGEIIMSMKETYEQKLQAQLDEWGAEIDKLKAKAAKAEADAQLEYYKQIEELRSMQEAANAKLAELKAAGDDAWEDLKAGIESAWDSLGTALKSASSRFK